MSKDSTKKVSFLQSLSVEARRNIIVYLYCLFISVVFWFLVVFTKEYNTTLNFPVRYINLPENKVVANQLPEKIAVDIRTTGFRLLGFKLFKSKHPLNIDVKNLKFSGTANEYYFETQTGLDNISKQINYSFKVNRVMPDIIYFNFKKKSYRRVPVKLNALFSFEKQYQINGKVTTNPAYIVVSGDQKQIRNIKYVETENLILRGLNKQTERVIKLKLPDSLEYVNLSLPVVNVKIPVEKFTEATVEIPVVVLNLPSDFTVKTFPEKIKITCNVPLSFYQKVKPELFTLRADYQETLKYKSNKLKVDIAVKPDYVKNIKLETDNVEFILKRKR